MLDQGVVYCLTDSESYFDAVLISALILRSFEPELPITIISNLSQIDKLSLKSYNISTRLLTQKEIPVDSAFVSRYVKTHLINWSPYKSTLYLDADILPCAPINDLWKYLDEASIAMAKDRIPTVEMSDHVSQEEKLYTLKQIPPLTIHFNSGVMLWRNNKEIQQLFAQWQTEWQIFRKQDQLALVRTLYRNQIHVAEIPRIYNVSPRDSVELIKEGYKIHLLHCWGGMVASGEYRNLARSRYPEIVEEVDFLFRRHGVLPI
jgi:lipopolysaccharide biosynthesis glycosyltransferase